jgi:hypothetical protein
VSAVAAASGLTRRPRSCVLPRRAGCGNRGLSRWYRARRDRRARQMRCIECSSPAVQTSHTDLLFRLGVESQSAKNVQRLSLPVELISASAAAQP